MFIVDTIGIFLLMWFVQKYDRTAELKFQKVPLFFIFADGPLLLDADILKIVCLAQRKKTSNTWLLFHSRHVKWTHCLPKDSLSRCRCLKKKQNLSFMFLLSGFMCLLAFRDWLFAVPWTVACQATLSMEFSRQEYWRVLPFPTPGDLTYPGIKLLHLLQRDSLPLCHLGSPSVSSS